MRERQSNDRMRLGNMTRPHANAAPSESRTTANWLWAYRPPGFWHMGMTVATVTGDIASSLRYFQDLLREATSVPGVNHAECKLRRPSIAFGEHERPSQRTSGIASSIESVKRAVEVAGVVSIVPRRTVEKDARDGRLCWELIFERG